MRKKLIVFLVLFLGTVTHSFSQHLPVAYPFNGMLKVSIIPNGATQTVNYSFTPTANVSEMYYYLYKPVGSGTWNQLAVTSQLPMSFSIPAGSYDYGMQIFFNDGTPTQIITTQTPAGDVNYVRIWEATAPEANASNIPGRVLADVKQTTEFFDGFGRPLQTVKKQMDGSGNDLVSAIEYDNQGRQTYNFLPFASNMATAGNIVNNGKFKTDPFQQQKAFYEDNVNGPVKGQGETYFYSQNEFEPSPLSRVTKSFAPGNSWVGTKGSGAEKSVQKKYLVNTATDNVRVWRVEPVTLLFSTSITPMGSTQSVQFITLNMPAGVSTVLYMYRSLGSAGNWTTGTVNSGATSTNITIPTGSYEYAIQLYFNNGTPSYVVYNNTSPFKSAYLTSATYAAGQLDKNITIDENSKQVIEFIDKNGNIVLKKVQLTAAADNGLGAGHTGWLCTYYMYDNKNRLRCVVQPVATEVMNLANSWVLSAAQLDEQCFRYEYDDAGRMIVKKVPGAGELLMVYDNRDRLVMAQDANMRAGTVRWMVTKYDALNRLIETGIWQNSAAFATHQSNAASSSAYPVTSSNYDIYTVNHYDDYNNLPVGLSAYISTWNNSTYFSTASTTWPYPQMHTVSNATKGKVTWSQARVIGSTDFISTVNYYDDKSRIIQSQSTNRVGGTDIFTTQYSWAGEALVTVQWHERTGIGAQEHTVITKMIYDDIGRVIKIKKAVNSIVNGQPITKAEQVIVQNEFDKIGQLKSKMLSPEYNSNNGLEKLEYDYNIQGWMLGMNRDYIASIGQSGTKRFGFELGYDKLSNSSGRNFTNSQYTGNITGLVWKSDGDDVRRKYDFSYDAPNRFMKGLFEQDDASANWNNTNVNYKVLMGTTGDDASTAYDANGNIKKMEQWGLKLNGSSVVDKMSYQYIANSNKLLSVTEDAAIGTTDNKLGDFTDKNTANNDYSYDGNGNIVLDRNKAISSITYNHLNLPSMITITGKGTITYTYDAAGNKLRKITTETGATVVDGTNTYININITTTTDYIAGLIFESKSYDGSAAGLSYSNKLQFAGHEEGRIRAVYNNAAQPHTLTGFAYDYVIKDHLGNVRMLLTDEVKPVAPYKATMEAALAVFEEQLFDNISTTRADKPAGTSFDSDGANIKVSKLFGITGTDKRKGPGVLLKVMAGDKFTAKVFGWYEPGNTDITQQSGMTSIANAIITTLTTGIADIGKNSAAEITTSGALALPVGQFLPSQPAPNTNAPKAYLNWVLLDDEQLKLVTGMYGAEAIPTITTGMQKQLMQINGGNQVSITKNGYLYVFVSNESKGNVYFDDLLVEHFAGQLLEETHYYPFGLVMSGISSKALTNFSANKFKYSGKEEQRNEFNDGTGIEWLDFGARMYDAQIGRWHVIDPLVENGKSFTPYNYTFNSPVMFVDPDGRWAKGSDAWNTLNNLFDKEKKQEVDYANARYNIIQSVKGYLEQFGGDITYASADAAAIAWSIQYGKASIKNLEEYSSLIYESEGKYAYTEARKWSPKSGQLSFKSAPGPDILGRAFVDVLKNAKTVGFIHSHGNFNRPSDEFFSRWIPGAKVDGKFDISGPPGTTKQGIAQQFPDLDMYLFTPAGNLYKRNRESMWSDPYQGWEFRIASGFYYDPKAKEYLKANPGQKWNITDTRVDYKY